MCILAFEDQRTTDRIASFLPLATLARFQLILSAYPQDGQCTTGQVHLSIF